MYLQSRGFLLIWAIHEETAVDTSTYDEDWLTLICALDWMASEVRFSPEILFYKLPYIVFNNLYHSLLFCNTCVNHCTLSQFWTFWEPEKRSRWYMGGNMNFKFVTISVHCVPFGQAVHLLCNSISTSMKHSSFHGSHGATRRWKVWRT